MQRWQRDWGRARRVRVGALKVRSLTGKVGAVAALATEAGVNVLLAMQETMIAPDSGCLSGCGLLGWRGSSRSRRLWSLGAERLGWFPV